MAIKNFDKAKRNKNDEFYTQLTDIENELRHYKAQLVDKIIFCNCDDPFESNFFKYFAMNFNQIGIKKLIATSYKPSPISGKQLPLFEMEGLKGLSDKEPYVVEINEVPDNNNDGAISIEDVEHLLRHDKNVTRRLNADIKYNAGDFRSNECVELLKQSDIVVTNPPFSLFREYVTQLAEYKKKFIIIGNKGCATYKEIFKLIKENKFWVGYKQMSGSMWFSSSATSQNAKIVNGIELIPIPCCWYTNMEVSRHNELLTLYKKYNQDEYPHYDNYDAINVDKVTDIPEDYFGNIGVPITFLDKYNPNQFEIIDCIDRYSKLTGPTDETRGKYLSMIDGVAKYARLIIKRKEENENRTQRNTSA